MGKVTISSSVEKSNSFFLVSPISGKETLSEKKRHTGLFAVNVSIADSEEISGDISLGAGDICEVYGPDGSGECVLTMKRKVKEGGGNATPYTQEMYRFEGVQK